MSENGNCLTFIWKIKNFNFCSGISGIHSPVFIAHVLGGTNWSLCLCPDSANFQGCVACYIRRENDDSRLGSVLLDYELAILSSNGSVVYSDIFIQKLYHTLNTNWETALHVNKEEVFLHKKNLFMPEDTLTIRCRMLYNRNPILQSESCFAETSIKTQCKSFVGTIKKFNCLELREIYPICMISSKENFVYSLDLCVAADDKFSIQILVGKKSFKPYRYKIFIRDITGNKVKYGQGECLDSKRRHFPLTLSKEHLMKNKTYYFPKNILTIECEITFSTGKTTQKDVEYEFDLQNKQECAANALKMNSFSKEYCSKSFTTLTDGLNSLFEDGILCDTKLQTPTKTFPAHMAVLTAQSKVFKSMFTNDLKKRTNKCVIIDHDADTVLRMLQFMYQDVFDDDLEYESAKNLCIVAYKFNIASLMCRCSNFLKRYILLNNCCDMLILAHKHEDENLKDAVKDYITKNEETVLSSGEWKNLEEKHPHLTIEIFRYMHEKRKEVG